MHNMLEQRHYIQEMQNIPNRWAHNNSNPMNDDGLYLYFDTTQRFLKMIDTDIKLIEGIQI